jgi:hypothetical protein
LNIDVLINKTRKDLLGAIDAIPAKVDNFYKTYTYTFASAFKGLAAMAHMLNWSERCELLAAIRMSGMLSLEEEGISMYKDVTCKAYEDALYWVLPELLKQADEEGIPFDVKAQQKTFKLQAKGEQPRYYAVTQRNVRLMLLIHETASVNATVLMRDYGMPELAVNNMLMAYQNIKLAGLFARAKVFVVDNAVLDSIEQASIGAGPELPPLPYPVTWIEAAHRHKTPNFGWLLSDVNAALKNGGIGGGISLMNVLRHAPSGAYDFEGFTLIDGKRAGYDNDGALYKEADEIKQAPHTKMPVRLLEYLSSKYIEYELCKRTYTGSSKVRRKQQYKPYHMVEIKKSYKQYLVDNPGVGVPLNHRVEVMQHPVKYRFCPKCDKRLFVRVILKDGECPECGAAVDLKTVKFIEKNRGPLVRKPDLVAQVARTFYRAREL